MNFVAYHFHIVAHTNLVHTCQLVLCPHTTCGIVGVAQQKQRGFLVSTLRFKVVPIYHIRVAFPLQRTFQNPQALIANARIETIVDWCLYKYLLARHCQGVYGSTDGWYYACSVDYPVVFYRPIVATLEPVCYGSVIAIAHNGIAKDTVLGAFFHSPTNGGSSQKVHICHPKRNNSVFLFLVPLHRVRATAVYKLVEIIFSHKSSYIILLLFDYAILAFRIFVVSYFAYLFSYNLA